MRPAPPILMSSPAEPGDMLEAITGEVTTYEVTACEGCFALCLVSRDGSVVPVGVRLDRPQRCYKYPPTSHPHRGHSLNLASRLNARFGLVPARSDQWFASYSMQPVAETARKRVEER